MPLPFKKVCKILPDLRGGLVGEVVSPDSLLSRVAQCQPDRAAHQARSEVSVRMVREENSVGEVHHEMVVFLLVRDEGNFRSL